MDSDVGTGALLRAATASSLGTRLMSRVAVKEDVSTSLPYLPCRNSHTPVAPFLFTQLFKIAVTAAGSEGFARAMNA
jgi:hypothetical protein